MSKRKSNQYLAMNEDDLNHEIENMPMKDSCDTVRRKIRALIDSGEMRVGEFQKAINVTSNAYSMFMGQNGPYKGSGSSVYPAAWAFFKKRELRGVKTIKKQRTAANAGLREGGDGLPSINGIVLDGEMADAVPVFDTCDEIRRKINAHLQKPSVTSASFLRDVAAQYHLSDRKIQSKQLNDFRSKKGPYAGNTSVVFYGAYVYFEKLRVKEGKPKSKMRLEMESIHGARGGMDVERRKDWVTAPIGASVSEDKFGRLHVSEPRRW